MYANTDIAADCERRGADRRQNGENADLAPLISAADHPPRQQNAPRACVEQLDLPSALVRSFVLS
jgi:hypothetical protein